MKDLENEICALCAREPWGGFRERTYVFETLGQEHDFAVAF